MPVPEVPVRVPVFSASLAYSEEVQPNTQHQQHNINTQRIEAFTVVSTQISTPTLQIGAKGSAVKDLQSLLLRRVGVGGLSADGDFGEITQLAVKVFQQRVFLESDGVVGPKTWGVLLNGGMGHLPTIRRGAQGPLVERLQRAMSLGARIGPLNDVQSLLGTRGYYFSRIDGDFGPMTEQAVKLFQQNSPFNQSSQSPVDGIVGPKTWEALSTLVARVSHIFL